MRLEQVTLSNFRGYREPIQIDIGDLTSFTGRNDAGKSTVLEALAIFFGSETVKADVGDLCVKAVEQHFDISCAFGDLPPEVVIDAQAKTSLADEYLLTVEGRLEIVKRYMCTGAKPKISVFAQAHHPSAENVADLVGMKIADLKKRAELTGVDMATVDKTRSSALRRAIWKNVGKQNDLQLRSTLIPLDGDDLKQVWEQIQTYIPAFALFQADRPSRDEDAEVQDPMRIAITEAIKLVEPQLQEIRNQVSRSAMAVAERTLEKLREMDAKLADELYAEFKAEPKWDGFKLALKGQDGIPINKRGSGVRRLILLNFFRAEAERRQIERAAPGIIYAVEEPETSQHPQNQRMLVKALLELSQQSNAQVILTTHVPGIAAMLPIESIRFVKKDDAGQPFVLGGGDDVLKLVANELGVLPDQRVRVLVCVEGPHDVSFLQGITPVVQELDNNAPDLVNDQRIAFVLLSGGNLKHWVSKNYLQGVGIPQVHLYDRDDLNNPKYQDYVDKVLARDGKDWASLTQKREMENYLHPDAIAEALKLPVVPNFQDNDDVPILVAKIVHEAQQDVGPWDEVSEKRKKEKESRVKKRLNEEAVKQMTAKRLLECDPGGEVVGWFAKIRSYITDD